jgi:hypothetical protein
MRGVSLYKKRAYPESPALAIFLKFEKSRNINYPLGPA